MPESQLSIVQTLEFGVKQLPYSDTAKLDCEILLLKVLNKNLPNLHTKTWLLTWPEKTLSPEQAQQFNHYIELRASGIPIAYITGEKDFWTFSLEISPATLIPRPETELLVECALEKIPAIKKTHVLDLGTGSGAIALAIASERKNCHVLATDISQAALSIAQKNAAKLALDNIHFRQSHWFDSIVQTSTSKFDIIVSNPPYIAEDDPLLAADVRKYEPSQALISNDNGLSDINQIIQNSLAYLSPQGWLLFEHGYAQADAVQALLKQNGFTDISTIEDLNQHPRVTMAQH